MEDFKFLTPSPQDILQTPNSQSLGEGAEEIISAPNISDSWSPSIVKEEIPNSPEETTQTDSTEKDQENEKESEEPSIETTEQFVEKLASHEKEEHFCVQCQRTFPPINVMLTHIDHIFKQAGFVTNDDSVLVSNLRLICEKCDQDFFPSPSKFYDHRISCRENKKLVDISAKKVEKIQKVRQSKQKRKSSRKKWITTKIQNEGDNVNSSSGEEENADGLDTVMSDQNSEDNTGGNLSLEEDNQRKRGNVRSTRSSLPKRNKRPSQMKCMICNVTYNRFIGMKRHMAEKHPDLVNTIPYGSFLSEVPNSESEIGDSKNGDDDANRTHECNICKATYGSKRGLSIHVSKVHFQGTFLEEENYESSMQEDGRIDSESDSGNAGKPNRKYSRAKKVAPKCLECNKTFKNQHGLTVHMGKIHENDLGVLIKAELDDNVAKDTDNLNKSTGEEVQNEMDDKDCIISDSPRAENDDEDDGNDDDNGKEDYQTESNSDTDPEWDEEKNAKKKQPGKIQTAYTTKKSRFKTNKVTRAEKYRMGEYDGVSKKCPKCGKVFPSPWHVHRHLKSHERWDKKGEDFFDEKGIKRNHQCLKCLHRFRHKSHLRSHLKTHNQKCGEFIDENGVKKNFKCSECGMRFRSLSHLQSHEFTHTDEKMFKCEKCEKSYKCKQSLMLHNAKVHNARPRQFRCVQCGKEFLHRSSFKVHLLSHNPNKDRTFACDKCDKKYRNLSTLKAHKKTHEVRLLCNICGYVCFRQQNLNEHLETHQEGRNKICNICGRGYKTKTVLRSHMRTHQNREFICEFCGRIYKTQAGLREHVVGHTGEPLPFPCTFENCTRQFTSKARLSLHMDVHLKVRNWECNYCEKKFIRKANMKEHIKKVHEKDNKLYCEECSMHFSEFRLFTQHMESHEGKRNFPCNFCVRRFTTAYALKRHHKLKHFQDRVYRCQVCNKGFNFEKDLSKHVLSHSAERLHACRICDFRFVRKAHLDRHYDTVHEIKESDLNEDAIREIRIMESSKNKRKYIRKKTPLKSRKNLGIEEKPLNVGNVGNVSNMSNETPSQDMVISTLNAVQPMVENPVRDRMMNYPMENPHYKQLPKTQAPPPHPHQNFPRGYVQTTAQNLVISNQMGNVFAPNTGVFETNVVFSPRVLDFSDVMGFPGHH